MEHSIVQEVMNKLHSIISVENPAIHSILDLSDYNQGVVSRSLLLFLCAEISSTPREQAVNQAVAVELLNLASLVHSDSVEATATKNGRIPPRHLWGEKMAVLAGDYFFAKMFHILSPYPSVLIHYADTIESLITSKINGSTGMRPKGKEAFLLNVCCKIGGTGGKLADTKPALWDYGTHLSMAYQLFEEMADKTSALDYIDKSLYSLSSLPSSPAKIQLVSLTLNLKKHIDELGETQFHAPAID